MPCMRMRMGMVERMMMVSGHERVKARTRQVVNEHSLRE